LSCSEAVSVARIKSYVAIAPVRIAFGIAAASRYAVWIVCVAIQTIDIGAYSPVVIAVVVSSFVAVAITVLEIAAVAHVILIAEVGAPVIFAVEAGTHVVV
jgi:hypothetical protein